MRAVIYARYSTDMQREASIEDQVRICNRLIEDRRWTSAEVYADMGLSGATHLRPSFQRLLEDARSRKFDVVVAESIDRISRDQEHIAGFHKQMTFNGIITHTVSEGAISELHIGLKGTMGALFLKDLAIKTHRGLEGRVRQGKAAGGLSFGYRMIREPLPDGTFTTGERAILEDEAAIVRRIFSEYLEGRSPRNIAARLNKEGVAGPRGSVWGASTIYGNWKRGTGILNNELYVGKIVWNRQSFIKDPDTGKRQARPNPREDWVIEDVPHLRIIDDKLWDKVKARQEETRAAMGVDGSPRPERAKRPMYLFSGLLTCGCCGGAFTLVGKTRYGCASSRNKGTCTNRRTIERSVLEERVLAGLRDRLLDADLIAEFVEAYRIEYNDLKREERTAKINAKRELGKVLKKIDEIVEAVCEGLYHPSMKAKLTDLETRKAELTALVEAPEDEPLRLHPGLAQVYRSKVEELVQSLNNEGAKNEAGRILRGLLSEIRLIPEDDGLAIELVGELASIVALGIAQKQTAPEVFRGRSVSMVAGVGFEPTTFRL